MFYIYLIGQNCFMNKEVGLYLKALNNVSIVSMLEKAKENEDKRSIVFLCVGNAKVWFDCFGPYVGSLLQKLGINYYVYGNVRSNILTNNIEEYVNMIYRFHVNPYIIVFDSSICEVEDFELSIKEGQTTCGAFSDNPFSVGDMKISCLVPVKDIKSPDRYVKMLSAVKRIGFFIKYVFGT